MGKTVKHKGGSIVRSTGASNAASTGASNAASTGASNAASTGASNAASTGASDSRFSHIATDLRFKPLKTKDPVISVDDDRFKEIRQISSVYNTQDPRGRKFNMKQQSLQHAIQLPSKKTMMQEEEDSSDAAQSDDEEEEEEDDEHNLDSDDNDDGQDIDDDDDEDSDNEDGDKNVVDEKEIESYFDMDDDASALQKMDKDMEVSVKDRAGIAKELPKHKLDQLLDLNLDIARGVDQYSGESSSSDEESSDDDEEEEEEYNWGETDKDAQWDVDGHVVEETRRLAVCNIEWDRFKAQDILMVLKSFAPEGGKVCRVAVYLSEFGKERLAEEEIMGPKEIKDRPVVNEDKDTTTDYESMRKYHFNRLKYYYAVAECNNLDTARAIYQSLDGTSLESGTVVDLRYIPDDMTFDDNPESECTGAPKVYDSKAMEGFSAANFVRAQYTWDDDSDERKKTIQQLADAETAKDHQHLDLILAGDSESEDDSTEEHEEVEEFTSMFEGADERSNADSIKKYRWLIGNADKFDHVREAETMLLKRALGDKALEGRPAIVEYEEGKTEVEDDDDLVAEKESCDEEEEEKEEEEEEVEEDDEYKDLTPFEKYLQKRKKKQKEYRKSKKAQVSGRKEKDGLSDIPDELKNDPFFKEELDLRRKDKLKREEEKRNEENKKLAQMELERQQREKELSLMMLDDAGSSGARHVDMRTLVKQAKEDATSDKKKISRWKLAKLKAKEKKLAKEGVVLTTGVKEATTRLAMPPPPVAPKKALYDERFSGIFDDHRANLDPSHPEFTKHHTPFMDDLMKEVQNKNIQQQNNKRRRIEKCAKNNSENK